MIVLEIALWFDTTAIPFLISIYTQWGEDLGVATRVMNVIVVQKGHNHDHGHKKQVLALLVDFMMGVHSSRRASVTHDAKPMTTMTRAFPACVPGTWWSYYRAHDRRAV